MPQILKIAFRILALAIAAAPCLAFPQTSAERISDNERIRALEAVVESFQEEQLQDSVRTAELVDALATLGLLYQEGGEHVLAATVVDRAIDLVRASFGLHSMEQAPLLRQLILAEQSRQDFAAAWELEQELLNLARRHPGDIRTVPILAEIAGNRIDLLERYSAGEFPPEVVLGCFYRETRSAVGSCESGSKGAAIRSILLQAIEHYEEAIDVMRRNDRSDVDALRELEFRLLRGNYLYGSDLFDPTRYEVGKRSLDRLVAYGSLDEAAPHDRIDARIQAADWELIFARGRKDAEAVLQIYQESYDQLRQTRARQASIDRLFRPEIPVVLPAFLSNPLESVPTQESAGHIDVGFEVTRHGRSRKVKILDTTMNATSPAKSRLVRLILRSRFRPMVSDGEFPDSSPVVLRYYLND